MAIYRGAGSPPEIVERDDGFITASVPPQRYFNKYPDWSKLEQRAMSFVRGRVLDIGCGAGRHGLYLQSRGFDVTGIDNSPGCVKLAKLRGCKKVRLMAITEIQEFPADSFDTAIMMGNNFGLFGGYNRAARLLSTLHRITSLSGRIIAATVNPYNTKESPHRRYHRLNRERGRMGGQLRLRVRHENIVGEWFDYLLVSQKELKSILSGTGWQIAKILADRGPGYTAILEKTW